MIKKLKLKLLTKSFIISVAAFFAVVAIASAVTTISANISTGGTLSVTGTSTLTGDVTATGDLALNGGDLTTTSATFNLANAATTFNIGSTNIARTINIGTGTDIDTLNIGTGATGVDVIRIGQAAADLALTDANWSITTAGLITTADDLALNGGDLTTTSATFNLANAATTFNIGSTNIARTINIGTGTDIDTLNIGTGATGADVIAIGGGVGTLAINTGDWDITTTGAMTGIGAITADGLITGTAGLTISGAAVSLNASSNFAVNIATGTSTGAVTIGGNSNTVAIDSSDWDITTTGAMTGIGAITSDGNFSTSGTVTIGSGTALTKIIAASLADDVSGWVPDGVATDFTITANAASVAATSHITVSVGTNATAAACGVYTKTAATNFKVKCSAAPANAATLEYMIVNF